MPDIKFYFAPGACSLAPHILLRETGSDFEAIAMRVNETRVTFPADFALINPKMRVPVITLDQNTITEVPAIATVIASLAPNIHLMGRTPMDAARVYEWMYWLSGTLHGGGFGHLFRPQRFSDDPAAFDGIKAKAFECIKDCFDLIEEKLVGVYAVGGALTAVDPYLFVFYRWGNETGFEMKEKYTKYTALVSNLAQRPTVKATLDAENIGSTL
jgi:glutathione S-transferase